MGVNDVAGLSLTINPSVQVIQRQQEFGISIALGATRSDVVRHVLRQGMLLAAIGAACGIAATLAAGRIVNSLLYGVRSDDPRVVFAVVAVMLIVSAVASFVPARRPRPSTRLSRYEVTEPDRTLPRAMRSDGPHELFPFERSSRCHGWLFHSVRLCANRQAAGTESISSTIAWPAVAEFACSNPTPLTIVNPRRGPMSRHVLLAAASLFVLMGLASPASVAHAQPASDGRTSS